MANKLTVGTRIDIAMNNMGYGIETLSAALGIDACDLKDWLEDKALPEGVAIRHLAEWLRVDAVWIMTGAIPSQNGYGYEQPFNGLSAAEAERLDILAEELSEAAQAIGKIKRHGYESRYPKDGLSNRETLEREMGDVMLALGMMAHQGDIRKVAIEFFEQDKVHRIKPYLHHQNWFSLFDGENDIKPYFLTADEKAEDCVTDNDWIFNLS